MNYPVKRSNLESGTASDNKQATLIVIESIVAQDFENLKFAEGVDPNQVLQDVQNWEFFNQYKSIVTGQKSRLNAVIANSVSTSAAEIDLTFNELERAKEIAENVFESQSKEIASRSKQKMIASVVSVAAITLLVVFTGTATLSSFLSSGRKSSSDKSAQVELKTSSDQSAEKSDSGVSTNSMRESVDSFGVAPSRTPNSKYGYYLGLFKDQETLVAYLKTSQSNDFASGFEYEIAVTFNSDQCSETIEELGDVSFLVAEIDDELVLVSSSKIDENNQEFKIIRNCEIVETFQRSS